MDVLRQLHSALQVVRPLAVHLDTAEVGAPVSAWCVEHAGRALEAIDGAMIAADAEFPDTDFYEEG